MLGLLADYGGARAAPRVLDVAGAFTPRYDVWAQRVCMSPDGDFFDAIGRGTLAVATDRVVRFARDGVVLSSSGATLPADVIVTATGFRLLPMGLAELELVVDGERFDARDRLVYRSAMMEGLPNALLFAGYTHQVLFTLAKSKGPGHWR